jgi:hypothetical protein
MQPTRLSFGISLSVVERKLLVMIGLDQRHNQAQRQSSQQKEGMHSPFLLFEKFI